MGEFIITREGFKGSKKADPPDYFREEESPLGFCHQGGTFSLLYTI